MFCPIFMPICPVRKRNEFIVLVTKKTPSFLIAILRPFGLERQNFNTCDLSSNYICL